MALPDSDMVYYLFHEQSESRWARFQSVADGHGLIISVTRATTIIDGLFSFLEMSY